MNVKITLVIFVVSLILLLVASYPQIKTKYFTRYDFYGLLVFDSNNNATWDKHIFNGNPVSHESFRFPWQQKYYKHYVLPIPANGKYILGKGDFYIDGTIEFPPGVIITGDGTQSTHLIIK